MQEGRPYLRLDKQRRCVVLGIWGTRLEGLTGTTAGVSTFAPWQGSAGVCGQLGADRGRDREPPSQTGWAVCGSGEEFGGLSEALEEASR